MPSIPADANPTKAFFISLITRDVNITDCIKDLIDNCIDGIVRHHQGSSLKAFKITLTIGPKSFEIYDNCGGIELDIAVEHAFRFGKPEKEVERDKLLSGRYGIGMKRSFFKLGRIIDIETRARKTWFSMHIDVDRWKRNDTPPWHFDIDKHGSANTELKKTFTRIRIKKLHQEVAQEFADSLFLTRLRHDLEFAYADRIRNGLVLDLNGPPVKAQKMELLYSSKIKPLNRIEPLDGVIMQYFAGLAPEGADESIASETAGWYVFCNNRLLVAGDKTSVTGWGKEHKNPAFHPQYNQFRGYVFFESNDPDKLPWNTAKNHINTESSVYRSAKEKLVQALREVVNVLNARKEARSRDDARYDELLEDAEPVAIWKLPRTPHFKFRVPVAAKESKTQMIRYERPLWQVETAMESLKVDSPRQVGEETFDYYFRKHFNDHRS